MSGGGSSGSGGATYQTPITSGTYGPLTYSDQTTMQPGGGGMGIWDYIAAGAKGFGKGGGFGNITAQALPTPDFSGANIPSGENYQPVNIPVPEDTSRSTAIPRADMVEALLRLISGR